VTREVLLQMGEADAEKYYSTVRAAIKGISPDILYLGDRNDKRNPGCSARRRETATS
jgi:hypothetical protein